MAHTKFCDLAGKPGALVYEPGSIYGCTCIVLPQDAGEYAEQLKKVLERFDPSIYPSLDCGSGWYKIIVGLDKDLSFLCPDYQIHQIKEKFGSLRFYWASPLEGEWYDKTSDEDKETIRDIMHSVTHYAEFLSGRVCEVCGNYGKTMVKNYWAQTLCNSCAKEKGYEEYED
jgi:hypothetical protein